jgi:ADP-ribosylglycohydrolase
MHSFTLVFPWRERNGRAGEETLEITALRPREHYGELRGDNEVSPWRRQARLFAHAARSAVVFMDATGLEPSWNYDAVFGSGDERRPAGCDHVRLWRSPEPGRANGGARRNKGRYAATIEPYGEGFKTVEESCRALGWACATFPPGIGMWLPSGESGTRLVLASPPGNGVPLAPLVETLLKAMPRWTAVDEAEFEERWLDLARGCLLGLAAGDASAVPMTLALAESLAARGGLDPRDLRERCPEWREAGADAASDAPLARVAPVVLHALGDQRQAMKLASEQSLITCSSAGMAEACALLAAVLWEAVHAAGKDALRPREWRGHPAVTAVAVGGWRGEEPPVLSGEETAAQTLTAAFRRVEQAGGFEEALTDDEGVAASNAATGQLAGAIWGASAIPEPLLERLADRERIAELVILLTASAN